MLLGRTIRSLSGLVAALLLSIGALAVNAPVVSAASGTPGPAASLPVQGCPSGVKLNLPTSSSIDADGWTRIDYNINGLPSYTEIPPVGFDVRQAPGELIARHHIALPSRPQTTAALAQWTAEMGKLQWVRTQGMCGPLPFRMGASHRPDSHWGGDAVYLTGSYQFAGVQAYQTQPLLNSAYCGRLSSLGSWVGLGGTYSGIAFLQAGTWALGPGLIPTGYGSFYEYFDSNGVDVYNGPVDLKVGIRANDSIFEYVTQISQNLGFVEVYNRNLYTVGTQYVTIPNSAGLGFSAEWIDERMPGTRLTQYAPTSWSSMYVLRTNSGGTWTGAYSEPNEWWYDIYDAGINLSKTTGSASNNTMSDHWKACGPNPPID